MRKLLLASALAFGTLLTPTIGVQSAVAKVKTVPVDYFAIRDAVTSVSISPDGEHVAVMKTISKDGDYLLEIYKTDDFSKPVRRVNADPMELFAGIPPRWVSNDVLIGGAWSWTRSKVRGPEDTGWDTLLYSYNIKNNKFKKLDNKRARGEGAGFSIVNVLPDSPDEILIATGSDIGASMGVDPFSLIRPRSYYKYNVNSGKKTLVLKGNITYGNIQFDSAGNPRFATGQKTSSENGVEIVQYYRKPGDGDWKEFGQRVSLDKYEDMYAILGGLEGPAGLKAGDPNTAYVITANGGDKTALYEYDLVNDTLGKKIFSTPDADVMGIQTHSNSWGDDRGKLAAVRYPGAKMERHWIDMKEKALHEQFASKIPNSHSISIPSRSKDGKTMIVFNSGPKDPGSYWLVRNGKMGKLGSRNPLLKPENLSNVEFIRYPARDGKMIPGYVTKPEGTGPFPLVVLPHGGPHVNEVIGYDEWGQFLANNGYMVLQPQYRMSVGWGRDHFDSAMGQHGLAMQDDKDDGAMYLVKKGLADPDKMAMFGWSYGGYAALVAASRDPNIYQCVIAGAAVADPKKVYLKRSGGGSSAGQKMVDDWARARGGFVGINPIEEIDKMNVPVFMIHPEQDARVLYFNFKDYRTEAIRVAKERATSSSSGNCTGGTADSVCTTTMYRNPGKAADSVVSMQTGYSGEPYVGKVKFSTLKEADHFSITLKYKHQKKLYTEMLDFLKNDCGPDGIAPK